MKRVAIAGSSGSIGTQTIDVVLAEPDAYTVTALAVASASDVVIEQARRLPMLLMSQM
jgi:1-deoxy-D-xylulose-5-phosphate reductoisomerase